MRDDFTKSQTIGWGQEWKIMHPWKDRAWFFGRTAGGEWYDSTRHIISSGWEYKSHVGYASGRNSEIIRGHPWYGCGLYWLRYVDMTIKDVENYEKFHMTSIIWNHHQLVPNSSYGNSWGIPLIKYEWIHYPSWCRIAQQRNWDSNWGRKHGKTWSEKRLFCTPVYTEENNTGWWRRARKTVADSWRTCLKHKYCPSTMR